MGSQPRRHSTASVERGSCVLPIDQLHESHILLVLFHGLVIQARPADSQQGTLPPYTDRRMFRFYPAAPIFIRASQLSFHPLQLHLQPANLLVKCLGIEVTV